MGNPDRDDLRFRSKTHRLEFDLLPADEPLAQVRERQSESKAGKGSSRFDFYFFRPMFSLVVFTQLRGRRLREEVCGKLARGLILVELFPRPLFLDQLGLLAKQGFFLETPAIFEL